MKKIYLHKITVTTLLTIFLYGGMVHVYCMDYPKGPKEEPEKEVQKEQARKLAEEAAAKFKVSSIPKSQVDTTMDLSRKSAEELKQIKLNADEEFNKLDAIDPTKHTPAQAKRYGELGAFYQRLRPEIIKKDEAAVAQAQMKKEASEAKQAEQVIKDAEEAAKKEAEQAEQVVKDAEDAAKKEAEQAAKFKEVADRLQPKQPTTWEKIKQGATTFKEMIVGKPLDKPIEIGVPTNVRKLSSEETAAKLQIPTVAPKGPETPEQVKERTAIQKLGDGIVARINKLTVVIGGKKLESGDVKTIKQIKEIDIAVNKLGATIRMRFTTATEPMRKTMSDQLDSINKGLNKVIARIPVDSPQRRELLTTKGMINLSRFYGTSERLAKAQTDPNLSAAEKLMAHTEFFAAKETLKRNTQSTGLGLAQETDPLFDAKRIRTLIQSDTTADFQKQIDAAKKEAVVMASKEAFLKEKLDTPEIQTIRASVREAEKRVDAATGNDKIIEAAKLGDLKKALTEAEKPAKQELADHQAKQKELADTIKRAEAALDTPATRLQKADAALKSAKKEFSGAVASLRKLIAKLPGKVHNLGVAIEKAANAIQPAVEGKIPYTKIEELKTKLEKAFNKFKGTATGVTDKAMEAISRAVDKTISGATRIIEGFQAQTEAKRDVAEEAQDKKVETPASKVETPAPK